MSKKDDGPELEKAGRKSVTLITGATKGIGRSFADEFAARGHALMLIARTGEELDAVAAELSKKADVEIYTFKVDLTDKNGCEAVQAEVRKQGLFVEYLVNNAGYGLAGNFAEVARDHMLNMVDLNVRVPTELARRFLPEMIAAGHGGVLNVSSMAGLAPGPYQANYYASKAYMNSLGAALAHEMRATGVKIGTLACGPVQTEFHSRMGAESAHYVKILGLQSPEEVARYATKKFLAGRRMIIPGVMHQVNALAMKLIPHFVLVPFMAWILKRRGPAANVHKGHMAAPDTGRIANWESGLTYRPEVIVRPETIDDIVRIVKDRGQYPAPVRAVGTLHSPARCSSDDKGTMVDMTGMTRIVEIGEENVTAEAGAAYINVAQELARQGLQFHINTEIGNVTLGAVACAATKDSSLIESSRYGQISSFVTGMKVVHPDGSVHSYTEEKNPQEMRQFRSSYGMLGIVAEVTLRVKPVTAIFVEHRIYSLAQFRDAVPGLVAENFALMMYYYPFADRIVVELRREVPDVEPRGGEFGWALRNAFWRKWSPFLALAIKRLSPSRSIEHAMHRVCDRVMRRGMTWFMRGAHTRPDAQIIRYPDNPGRIKYVFSMWSFGEKKFFEILEAYFGFCHDYAERTGYRCDLPAVGYRIVQDRNALLSYTHDGTVLSIDPASTGGEGWDAFLKEYNNFCSEHGGMPMLNQTKHLTAAQVQKAFGKRLQEFETARRERDPKNLLLNSYFAEFLDSGRNSGKKDAAEQATASSTD